MRRRLTTLGAVVLALVVVAAGVTLGLRWWDDRDRTDLQRALSLAPEDGQRFSWTDWSGVRAELGLDLSTDPTSQEVTDLLAAGFTADLTSTSALVESAEVLEVQFGFSPASVEWELFSQSERGALVMLGLPETIDFDDVADDLRRLGYDEPESATGVWRGDPDQLARIGSVTPELLFIALDAEEGLAFTSDTQAAVEAATENVERDAPVAGLSDVADALGAPLAAAIYDGDYACGALAMGQADPTDQDQAAQLIEAAGELNPVTGFAMAIKPGGDVLVAMSFETEAQARTNADTRAVLAAGPAPGQGGDFADRFSVGAVTADGLVVVLDLQPVANSYVLSDLSNGPVLFATC